ncbi:MAG: glycosyltransferase [Ferruginibacter sp.]
MKKIVLITTGQPATNPRIVKEADALQNAGYEVIVLYCFFISWALDKEKVLLKQVSWKYQMVGGSPGDKKKCYFFTRLRSKLAGILTAFCGPGFLLAERIQARAYDELLNEAKKIKADWYIGHNLGALAVAVNAAVFHGAKAGFDFEDHYRGENDPSEIKTLKRIAFLENKYVSSLSYFSAASEMIIAATKKNHPTFKGDIVTLLNCFPLQQQPALKEKGANDHTLNLFWFSQTIGTNRGLETLINALKILKDPSIHVTLAGRCNDDMERYIKTNAGEIQPNIHFAGIVQPETLPEFASHFDVGMAIELDKPVNRDMCLTNKIFTYLLAGNAVILSETSMQLSFNREYHIGESFAVNDEHALAEKIKGYHHHQKLNEQKQHNYELARTRLNWENESRGLLTILDKR